MATGQDLTSILLQIVQQNPDCNVEELTARCPGATWNQVFLALDSLSRSGQVAIRRQGPGHYQAALAPQKPAKVEVSLHHRA